jgi:multiple sugar transport system permease protein
VVTSIVAVSVVWKFLLREQGGLVNTVLGWVGVDGPAWLDNTALALPTLVVMAVWRNFGTLMVIFLAALQTVPRELLEAAETDGASGWSRFRHITLPILRPTMLFGAVITSIGYLQFFEEAFVMTKGGPLDATRSVTFFTYDQFGFGNYGLAASASYLLFIAVVVLTFVQFRLLREKD